jgi:hypothetical protein
MKPADSAEERAVTAAEVGVLHVGRSKLRLQGKPVRANERLDLLML